MTHGIVIRICVLVKRCANLRHCFDTDDTLDSKVSVIRGVIAIRCNSSKLMSSWCVTSIKAQHSLSRRYR